MWDVGMAKLFKDRNNKDAIGNVIGKVVSEKPLKIAILNGLVLLDKEQLYKSEHIHTHYYDDIKKIDLFINDEVLLIPTSNEQSFYIIDKIQKVGD